MSAHHVKRPKHSGSRSTSPDHPHVDANASCPERRDLGATTISVNAEYPATYPLDDAIFADLDFPQALGDQLLRSGTSFFASQPFTSHHASSPPATAIAELLQDRTAAIHEGGPPPTADDRAVSHGRGQCLPDLTNPFQDNASEWIPTLDQARQYQNPVVNGYIKFRYRPLLQRGPTVPIYNASMPPSIGSKRSLSSMNTAPAPSPRSAQQTPAPIVTRASVERVPRSPPGFGYFSMNEQDSQLFVFYRTAWCTGRTILSDTNCWLRNIPAMAQKSQGVQHAMLALAGTYVLDYVPLDTVRRRSNRHYNGAVKQLTQALETFNRHTDFEEAETLVASLALLNMMDVVSPERRRPIYQQPRWLQGAQTACDILNRTDSGYRYWANNRLQPSDDRTANAIISSRVVILALPMTPLAYISTDNERFQFLLAHATESDTRQIHGACGCSPRLLHRLAQITYITTLLFEDNDSPILPVTAKQILRELENLRQWCDLGDEYHTVWGYSVAEGYASTEALLADCDRNIGPVKGVVQDVAGMTYLTAEAWRLAAIVYAQCRLLRLPRSHIDVISNITKLSECVRRMPTSGPLFTAQAPFFPVFLLGLLAPTHPAAPGLIAHNWFVSVTGTSCRSSVPPVYEAMKRIREWMDHQHIGLIKRDVPASIGSRHMWWEDLVCRVKETEGILCLV